MSKFGFDDADYAGDITPEEAWEMLKTDDKAQLVDVRTVAEWNFVGYPSLATLNKKLACVCWRVYPQMAINDAFEQQLKHDISTKDGTLLFLCRSGVRSREAAIAMTAKGYSNCYNIAGGFEGDLDEGNHRGTKHCWKSANLPWEQY